ncbi:MAG TPA: hypothetical protein VLF63_00595 [Patescibacteria group bacterium]|nr:hypothetical protein [Patescibacteria group bacterium]
MDVYAQIAIKIIKGQETIIGPVAIEQARRVPHLKVDWDKQEVKLEGDEAKVLDTLIEVYKELFGEISVEVSKEAASSLIGQIDKAKIPDSLK